MPWTLGLLLSRTTQGETGTGAAEPPRPAKRVGADAWVRIPRGW
jgi:hypothetical protein